VYFIGPYTLKGKDETIIDFMFITRIDPATSWFEITEFLIPHPSELNISLGTVQRDTWTTTNISKKNKGTLTNCQRQLVHYSTGPGLVDTHVVSISSMTTEVNLNFTLRPSVIHMV